MVGENRYKVKLKGAFEYYNVESWAKVKKGGTAEFNFVPLGLRPFFIIKNWRYENGSRKDYGKNRCSLQK